MKIFEFLSKNREKKQKRSLSDFFLHAPKKEKIKIFTEAARRANEDQRKLVENANNLQQKAT
jgi:hypothetical protein